MPTNRQTPSHGIVVALYRGKVVDGGVRAAVARQGPGCHAREKEAES